ncbi:hypothetical protein TELCIR_02963 [Teladorsagia circumcincta]|uniref:Uncharacterized protein n=1 Tax=Teladorsagia circumcincta TaxID=45464 RepID=A0A2G9UXZ5_TELCI|nr:hypothetical protein TELCIR_02963 [Teladorsagia circumcincta]
MRYEQALIEHSFIQSSFCPGKKTQRTAMQGADTLLAER